MPPKARSLPAAAQSKRPSADSTTPRHTVPHHIADPLPSSAIHVPDASPTPQPKRKRTRSSRYAFLETLDADDAPTTALAAARAAASTAAIAAAAVSAAPTAAPAASAVPVIRTVRVTSTAPAAQAAPSPPILPPTAPVANSADGTTSARGVSGIQILCGLLTLPISQTIKNITIFGQKGPFPDILAPPTPAPRNRTAFLDALAVTAPATSLPVSEEVAEISVCILRVFCVFVRLR